MDTCTYWLYEAAMWAGAYKGIMSLQHARAENNDRLPRLANWSVIQTHRCKLHYAVALGVQACGLQVEGHQGARQFETACRCQYTQVDLTVIASTARAAL